MCSFPYSTSLEVCHYAQPTLKGREINLYLLERGVSNVYFEFLQVEVLLLLIYLVIYVSMDS